MDDSTIQILNTLITVFGTLIGAVIGILGTIYVQNKMAKIEEDKTYKLMLKERKDDLIIPLFKIIQEMLGNIANYSVVLGFSEIGQIESSRRDLDETLDKLKIYIGRYYDDIAFLFPNPFPWILMPFCELIEAIINKNSDDEEFNDMSNKAVNTLIKIEEDIKNLMGLSVSKKMKTKFPF